MKKFRLLLTALGALTFAALTPLAHADFAEGAHQFKSDVKMAGKETGHAIAHGAKTAGHAIAHGARTAGHAIANTTSHGYHATRRWVKEKM